MAIEFDSKLKTLRANGTLNPHPGKVTDALFHNDDFFDPSDLLQVKYEMLRRVDVEGWSVTQAAGVFGLSRPAFYHARAAFCRDGLAGLIPKKRGPKDAFKLSAEVIAYVQALLLDNPDLMSKQLIHHIAHQFGVVVHPRSIERALARQEKKRGAS